jgi:hypothetical protein
MQPRWSNRGVPHKSSCAPHVAVEDGAGLPHTGVVAPRGFEETVMSQCPQEFPQESLGKKSSRARGLRRFLSFPQNGLIRTFEAEKSHVLNFPHHPIGVRKLRRSPGLRIGAQTPGHTVWIGGQSGRLSREAAAC